MVFLRYDDSPKFDHIGTEEIFIIVICNSEFK